MEETNHCKKYTVVSSLTLLQLDVRYSEQSPFFLTWFCMFSVFIVFCVLLNLCCHI